MKTPPKKIKRPLGTRDKQAKIKLLLKIQIYCPKVQHALWILLGGNFVLVLEHVVRMNNFEK
jgi:hypothetical protein